MTITQSLLNKLNGKHPLSAAIPTPPGDVATNSGDATLESELLKSEPHERPNVPSLRGLDVDAAADAAKKKSNADRMARLNSLISQLDVFQDQYGDFVLLNAHGQRREVVQLDSTAADDFISRIALRDLGSMPGKAGLDQIKTMLRINCQEHDKKVFTNMRIGKNCDALFLDLGNTCGQMVRITDAGVTVECNTSIAFKRGRGYGVLPALVPAANTRAALTTLVKWAMEHGVPKQRALVFVISLAEYLRLGTPYPVLSLYGPPGSGKSTVMKLIIQLMDPTESGGLRHLKLDADNLAAAAQHRHVLTFDNVTRLSGDEQDLLCTCSTGGEIMVRKLYTNSDSAVLPIHRPVVITSVQPVVTRPDLLSRTIPIEFGPRGDRQIGERELLEKFITERPTLLGALGELCSAGLRHAPGAIPVKTDQRLHDFCELGEGIVLEAGFPQGYFLECMDQMRASGGAEFAAGDRFVRSVTKILGELNTQAKPGEYLPGWKAWFPSRCVVVNKASGDRLIGIRPSELFSRLRAQVTPTVGHEAGWLPKNERETASALLRATPIFIALGINLHKREPSSGNSYWEFTVPPEKAEEA